MNGFSFILAFLGFMGLSLTLDVISLAFWKSRLDERAFLAKLRKKELPPVAIRKYNRAMFYSGLSLLPEDGNDGAAVVLVGTVSLALLAKAIVG